MNELALEMHLKSTLASLTIPDSKKIETVSLAFSESEKFVKNGKSKTMKTVLRVLANFASVDEFSKNCIFG